MGTCWSAIGPPSASGVEHQAALAALAQTLQHFGDSAETGAAALAAFDHSLARLDARLAEEKRAADAAAALEAAAAQKRDQPKAQPEGVEALNADADLRISRGEGAPGAGAPPREPANGSGARDQPLGRRSRQRTLPARCRTRAAEEHL